MKNVILLVPLALTLSGCASMIQQSRNNAMDSEITGGQYESAALLAEDRMGLSPDKDGQLPEVKVDSNNVLNHLDAAQAWNLAGNHDRSIAHYDAAETALKEVETQNGVIGGAKLTAATLVSESSLDYLPSPGEAVLINMEKAIQFWEKGDFSNTRVEFNRANDRTRRAVDWYREEIAEASKNASNNRAANDGGFRNAVTSKYNDGSEWEGYKDFIVPQMVYLNALFLSKKGKDASDRAKSADLMKRVAAIAPENELIRQEAREAVAGRICPDTCGWVVVEYGLGPTLVERRFDLPIPTSRGLIVGSMALPKLQQRTLSDAVHMGIRINGKTIQPAYFASMDRVIKTEFDKRWPAILTRAIVSGTAKAVAQVATNEATRDNPYAGLINAVVSIASVASTSADLRMWRSMPSRWAVTRFRRMNGKYTLSLDTSSGEKEIPLPDKGSFVIYIKAPNMGTSPAVSILPL